MLRKVLRPSQVKPRSNEERSARPYYARKLAGDSMWYVLQSVQGNESPICATIHGQPDAEMIADALNAWLARYDET